MDNLLALLVLGLHSERERDDKDLSILSIHHRRESNSAAGRQIFISLFYFYYNLCLESFDGMKGSELGVFAYVEQGRGHSASTISASYLKPASMLRRL